MDFDIRKLAELLNPKKDDDTDSDNDEHDNNDSRDPGPKGPGEIGKKGSKYKCPYDKSVPPTPVKVTQDEGDFDLVDVEPGVTSDWREAPQWELSYKQQVTPCDMFLQMSGKNPSTASCEDMIIKIHLPNEKHRNIDLKILNEQLILVSPKFRLDIPLPNPVDPKFGNAQWDKVSEKLIVTLKMQREFDYVNF